MGRTTYLSTRGGERGLTFEQIVLRGLAKDKGLYLPEVWDYDFPHESPVFADSFYPI